MSAQQKYDVTAVEGMKSLNYFDEIAIAQAFKKDFDDLNARDTVRAVIFIYEKRAGSDDKTAANYAKSLSMGQLDDHFVTDPDEIDPDAPDTEAGKAPSADG